ncbi:MAG: Rpn family recombination-promoting nuclease/putative transposase, partial [Chitinivibrionales bacterium]|nr:Rpn family recombination-promoting nuclease/putative transposase [Chitinivibrionales bacterium]
MEDMQLNNPHDLFFKEVFGQKEAALGFFRAYLPSEVFALLEPDSLERVNAAFVDQELTEHFSDILYAVSIQGMPAYLYLLFEHKSYVDEQTPLQLLRYMVRIWESHLKEDRTAKRLPVIIPLVLYHGPERWKVGCDFRNLFEVNEVLTRYIPTFAAEIYDLSHLPDEEIRGELLVRASLLVMKYIFDPALIEHLPRILLLWEEVARAKGAKECLEIVIRYLASTLPAENRSDLSRAVVTAIKESEVIMPTIAQKWV